jgi:hypothetical protein
VTPAATFDITLVLQPPTAWLLVRECERAARAQSGDAPELRAVARALRAALGRAGVAEPESVMVLESRVAESG